MKTASFLSAEPDDGNVLYLPLEVCRRELAGKIFLATHLAKLGHTVVLFPSDFFDRYGWPAKGIYIGKNCFRTEVPYKTNHYEAMKASGVSVWYLDEEGGIYPGQDISDWKKRLELRLDPKTLGAKDKILCWGKWQAEVFKEKTPEAEVLVVGSPNFDVFSPKYQEAFKEYDLRQTEGEANYILVNTRFSFTNGFIDLIDHLTGKGPTSKFTDSYQFSEIALTEGALQHIVSKLVLRLAQEFPDNHFIVRPHPAEDPRFYRAIFHAIDNVSVRWTGDVGAWIRMSSALIHNGCTTALQAALANKPVITYVPLDEPKKAEMKLPNSIGTICASEQAVIDALRGDLTSDPIHESINDTVEGTQCIDRIGELLQKNEIKVCSRSNRERLLQYVSKRQKIDKAKQITRRLLGRISAPMSERIRKERSQFDFDFFNSAVDLHSVANNAYNSKTSIMQYKETCYVVFPSDLKE